MPVELEGRTQYLFLAPFAQNLLTELQNFLKTGDEAKLKPVLQQALTSLENVQSGEVTRFGKRNAAAFNTYEQIVALAKAWSKTETDHAIILLRELVQDPIQKKENATSLTDLFSRLQVQALWSFERPEGPATEGLRELCQSAS